MKYAKPRQIRNARHAAGLTQQRAAALIRYSERAWQEWEAGRRNMRLSVFLDFADAVRLHFKRQ